MPCYIISSLVETMHAHCSQPICLSINETHHISFPYSIYLEFYTMNILDTTLATIFNILLSMPSFSSMIVLGYLSFYPSFVSQFNSVPFFWYITVTSIQIFKILIPSFFHCSLGSCSSHPQRDNNLVSIYLYLSLLFKDCSFFTAPWPFFFFAAFLDVCIHGRLYALFHCSLM